MAINNEELLDKLVRTGMMMRHIDGGPCPHKHGGRGHGMCHDHEHGHGQGPEGHGAHDGDGEGGRCGHASHEGHGPHAHEGKRGHKRRGQARVLTMVSMKEGINQKDLAFLLGIRPQTLGEMLQKLEAHGLVVRAKSQSDGRAVEVSLTDAGRVRAAEIAERRAVAAADMFAALTDEEKEQLDAILDKLSAELDKHRPAHGYGKCHHGKAAEGTEEQDA